MGCVGFGGSSWSASNLCSFLPSLLYPQPCLAAPSVELGHLGCNGRGQLSYSDCCCDLGWSFRAIVLQREKSVPSLPPAVLPYILLVPGQPAPGGAGGSSPPIGGSGHSHTRLVCSVLVL